MNREDIIRMAEEAGIAIHWVSFRLLNVMRFAALVAAAEREKVARFIMAQCFVTGHGDSIESMLDALVRQVAESEREQCAKVCDEKAKRNFTWGSENSDRYHAQADWAESCAKAIRARGKSHD